MDTPPEFKTACSERTGAEPLDDIFHLPADGICLQELETSLMKQALAHSNGNQTRAAKLLGLSRDQFRYRWKKIKENARPRLIAVAAAQR